jgi:hypothetical protein
MNNISGYSIGDKVRLKTFNADNHPEAFRGVMTVDSLSPALKGRVGVQGKGDIGAFFPAELERDGFRVGDRVEFVEDYSATLTRGVKGTVTGLSDDGILYVSADNGTRGSCFSMRVKHVEEVVEVVEQEAEPQPVTYRICVGSTIGKTEYPSLETAKAAALLHGKDGEEFSIWEVVKVADFRVKVTKSLEPVETL